ncbi:ribokinase [Paenibacillus sp. BK033]|uniref:ribokinase n=1 Tax=Paenibacillus sp. BK033 TaxID=2512133 RepID=UPI0010449C25|nr:ribokinase [Paenibacillus sp. BK033]TCM92888.1 ribokinase [Paenibacillus sp. BK033]
MTIKHRPKLVVIGSLNMDIVVETNAYPQVGETITGQRVRFIPGGKGANQAVAGARLGADTVMIGAVGDDAFGEELLGSLRKDGVDIAGVKRVKGTASGIASIYVAEGDNSIVVVPGANGLVEPADIDRNEDKLKEADLVLLQLEIPVQTVLYAARKAKALGKLVVLNPAPAQQLPEELFGLVDYFTPNRTELSGYANRSADGESLEPAIRRMMELGAAHVVTTLGASGSAYLDGEGKLVRINGYKMPVVDTTGAGDCYNAALAVALASGRDLRDAVDYASMASALAVTKFGAQTGMPTEEEVARFAKEQGKEFAG